MSNNSGEQIQVPKEELQQLMNIIAHAAVRLYDLMKAGSTIEVQIPESKAIIMPNQPPKIRRLLITKPTTFAQVLVKPKE